MHILTLLLLLIMPIAGDVQVTMPLTTKVGHTLMEDLDGTWDPWESNVDDTWANDFWYNQTAWNSAAPPEVHGGSLVLLADHDASEDVRRVLWVESERNPAEYSQGYLNLTDSSLHFRWRPFLDGSGEPQRISKFQAIDIGYHDGGDTYSYHYFYADINANAAGTPYMYFDMNVEWWDDTTLWTKPVDLRENSTVDYDEDTMRWLRLRHDESAGIVYFETAGPDCNGWTVREQIGPFSSDVRMNAFYIELIHEVYEGSSYTIGGDAYFGPLNEIASKVETMPLFTLVSTLHRAGGATLTLPLNSEIGDY